MNHRLRTRIALAIAALRVTGGLTAACGWPVPVDNLPQSEHEHPRYPTEGRPTRIAINHNSFEAKHVGHTADGGQSF
jgi:hypothetical protein